MDLGQHGAAASSGLGGAIIGAIATFFGLKQRVDRAEADIALHKQEIADSLKEFRAAVKGITDHVVFRDTCGKCEARKDDQVDALQRGQDEIRDGQKDLLRKVDLIIANMSRRRDDKHGS